MTVPSFIKSLLTCNISQPIKCYFHREDTMQLQDQSFINAATISDLLTSFPGTRRLSALNLTNKDFYAGNLTLRSPETTSLRRTIPNCWILNMNNAFKITFQRHAECLNTHYKVLGRTFLPKQSLNWSRKKCLLFKNVTFAHGGRKWGPGSLIMATLGLITH